MIDISSETHLYDHLQFISQNYLLICSNCGLLLDLNHGPLTFFKTFVLKFLQKGGELGLMKVVIEVVTANTANTSFEFSSIIHLFI